MCHTGASIDHKGTLHDSIYECIRFSTVNLVFYSQQEQFEVKGQGKGQTLAFFLHRLWTGSQFAGCATATCCTNKTNVADCKAFSSVRGELVQVAGLW